MAIICAPRLCLRDIKLFTGIIGFYSEQISTCAHTRAHKKTKCVSFICPQFSVFAVGTREEGVEGGGCLSLYSFKTAAYSCTTMHSSHNDKSVSK